MASLGGLRHHRLGGRRAGGIVSLRAGFWVGGRLGNTFLGEHDSHPFSLCRRARGKATCSSGS